MRLLLILLAVAGCVLAQNTEATADFEADYLRTIASWSDNSEDAIRGWRQRLAAYTELAPMLVISRRANARPDELIEQRDNGMTWGEIARNRKVRTIPGTDFIDESNLFALSQHYRRPVEEVRGMRRGDMSFLRLNEELRRAQKSRSQ